MRYTRAKVLLSLAVLCGTTGVGLVVSAVPAQAAPVTIAGCPTSTGSQDTATISTIFDDSLLAVGNIVPLHDRIGVDNGFYNGIQFDPAAPDPAMSAPVCGVERTAAGTLRYHWLYCTEKPLNVCGNAPWVLGQSAAAATLTTLEKARLAYVLDVLVDNATQATRAQSQRLVWCVTERVPSGAPAPEYLGGGEPALNCPVWPPIDATLNLNPQLTVGAAPATATAGGTVTFTVTTNVSPLDVTAVGLDALAPCPGQAGVTLSGGVLTIDAVTPGRAVGLCGSRVAGGNGSISVSFANPTVSTLQFWQRAANNDACQGMLSTEIVPGPGVTAEAQATWLQVLDTTTPGPTAPTTAPPTPSTTPPTDPGVPTTRPPEVLDTTIPNVAITLPRTGSGQASTTALAGTFLVLIGGLLVWAGRRRPLGG